MSKRKKNWNELIRFMRMPQEDRELHQRVLEEIKKNEMENFLFLASGDGCIIRGMHYPDSAFLDDNIPLIYRTSEENVLIAAYPQSLIKQFLAMVQEKSKKENIEDDWAEVVQALSTIAEEKIKKGEVNESF